MDELRRTSEPECTAAADHHQKYDETCAITAFQHADLHIPVTLNPNAVIGEIRAECCGRPVISCKSNPHCRCCEINIEQKLCIKVPIRYTASADVGDVEISCCNPCEKHI